METTEDSSARYFPLSQTIGAEYVSLFAMSRTIADSLGRCYLLSPTIRDEYVFHFSMFNRLSDGYPGRGVLNTPLVRLSSTPTPFAGRLVGRMQYAPTLPAEKSDLKGWRGVMFGAKGEESVFLFSMSNRLSDRYPGRGVLHTPHNHSQKGYLIACQTIVGRMQCAPTLPAEKSDLKGWREVMSETRGDESVFHSIMSNRLSDKYPGRAQKNTPLARLSSTLSPLVGRFVGLMQYAPILSEKDEVSLGRYFSLSRTISDKYVFHFFMSNRLSDRYPGRTQKHTPHIDSTSTPPPFAERLVGRMQYAPTLPEKDEVSLVRYFPSSRTVRD